MPLIDLNCDLGEGMGADTEIFWLISSANIACGGHAGDAESMRTSVELAIANGVTIGAHPSFPDREGFGRREIEIESADLLESITGQVTSLMRVAESLGTAVRYLKPHGALYNRAAVVERLASIVAQVASQFGLPVLGLPRSAIQTACAEQGVKFFREAFADRGYLPDGSLAPRGAEGSVIKDPEVAASRAIQIATEGTVVALDGSLLQIEVDSLCLHSDTPGAARMVAAVRSGLSGAGVEVRSFG